MRRTKKTCGAGSLSTLSGFLGWILERPRRAGLNLIHSDPAMLRRLALARLLPVSEPLEPRVLLSVSVTTYHNDLTSTGQNLAETLLTPSNVNVATFGKLYSTTLDGQVYPQPLIVPGLSINGGTHDVVFVATEHDSVYALDAANGSILWHKSFINPGAGVTTPSSNDVSSTDISPEIGITSTPVIDSSTNTIYFVAMTREVIGGNTHYIYRLHAMSMADGSEKFGGPAVIGDTISNSNGNFSFVSGPSVAGNGAGAVNGRVTFNAVRERQRVALSMVNGVIYVGFGSFGDTAPYHGWILGYDVTSLQLRAVFCDNPNSNDDGIWGGGGRIASDSQGNLYFETGNGGFDANLNAAGFPSQGDYGDSFVKLSVDSSTASNPNINGWGLKVVDYFTPFNQQSLSNGDTDLGSGDVVLLPDSVGSAAHPHLLLGGGKEGRLYLIDRDNMGHFDPNTDHVVQELPHGVSGDLGTPAFFNGRIYITGGFSNDVSHAFTIANGIMSTTPVNTPDKFSFPGATPTISANGNSNGVVWDVDRNTQQLRAYDASNYSNELYNSAQAANDRDKLGSGVKFGVATEANGQVYVGTSNSIVAYGLLSAPTTAPAAPTNLAASAVGAGQINLTWTRNSNNESGFLIEDSTDGTNFTQVGGASAGATTFAVTKLQPLTKYTFRVRAYNNINNSAYTNTAVATTPASPPPGVLDFSSGFSSAASLLSINGPQTAIVNSRLRLTDGNTNETTSVFSNSPVDITKFNTQFNFQLTNAGADGFTFAIQGDGPTTVGPGGGGLGFGTNPGLPVVVPSSVAVKFDIFDNFGEGNNSTGLYVNGALPTTPSVNLSGTPINFHGGDIINAALAYDGTTLTVTLTDTVTHGTAQQKYNVNIPQQVNGSTAFVGFTAASGGIGAVQDILSWSYSPTSTTQQLSAPSNFAAAISTGTQISLSWNSNSTGTNILIERSINGGGFSQIASVSPSAGGFLDTQLNTGVTYAYRARAQSGTQFSGYTTAPSVTTPTIPLAPTNAHTTLVTSTGINIAWTPNANNADGYRVYRMSTTGGQFILIATTDGAAQSYNDTGLPSGTPIQYDIEAFNLAGFSAGANISTKTIAAPPTSLFLTQGGNGQNTLSWVAPLGADSYNIYRGTTSGGESNVPIKTGVTATTFVDSNVTVGVTYYYLVTAVNSGGESSVSNETSATAQGQSSQSWTGADIGSPDLAGSSSQSGGTFTLTAGGADIWLSSDQFQFNYQTLAGDGTIVAHVVSIANTHDWAKAGVMIRESLSPTANNAYMLLSAANGAWLQYRNASAPQSTNVSGDISAHITTYWVKLVRTGGSVTAFESPDGVGWTQVGGPVAIATGTVDIGLAVTSHNTRQTTTAVFDHVSLTGAGAPPVLLAPASPSNLSVSGTVGAQINLSWTDNSTDESGFIIDRATDSLFTQNLKSVTVNSATPSTTGPASFTDNSTAPGLVYFYRVRATSGHGDSSNSNTAQIAPVVQPGSLPGNWKSADIGAPALTGTATYNFAAGAFTLTGGGFDIWWSSDQFQYAYQSLAGDGSIVAHVQAVQALSDWAKGGIMIRQSLAATSNFAMMALTPGHGVRLQSRSAAAANGADVAGAQGVGSYWVKLVRAGNLVSGFQSSDGVGWTQVGGAIAVGSGAVFFGLAVTSHNMGAATTAFDHVSTVG